MDLNTNRFRVSKNMAAIIVNAAARRGIWCNTHGGIDIPVEIIGVVREGTPLV